MGARPGRPIRAALSLTRHGLVRSGALAVWRLCRCHRFARGGFDPPP
jgi:putative component of membrane protein insertase Oxa1/YidC/SpoIIIJ protein YidD